MNSERILITDRCDGYDLPEIDGVEIANSGPIRECFISDGSNMIIWTTHLTSFGTIASAGSGGGSGGSGGGWRSSLVWWKWRRLA